MVISDIVNPFSRVDLTKLLKRLDIKAKARNSEVFIAKCPFPEHEDRNPSWFIRNLPNNTLHGAHKCSSCGRGGGLMHLVKTVLGLSDEDARTWLLDLSLPAPVPTRIEEELKAPVLSQVFKLPECFQFKPIEGWPKAHAEYILRRATKDQIQEWGIGFVTKCKCKNNRHSDRIAIPVKDENGIIQSYTTRHIGNSRLRYVEPEKSEKASRVIFGQQKWNEGYDYIIVVEGIFDALAIEQLVDGVALAALRGSSPRAIDLLKLSKFKGIVVVTDNDKAGDKARKAIKSSCSLHTNVVDLIMPPKVDPSKIIETYEGRNHMIDKLEKSFESLMSI